MRWPWVSRLALEEARAFARSCADMAQIEAKRAIAAESRYDALLEKYHALRPTHAAPEPQPPVVTSPINDLGPQTLAALDAMGKGQTGMVRRAMQARAIQLWHEFRDKDNRDDLVAKAVWHGEAVMPS